MINFIQSHFLLIFWIWVVIIAGLFWANSKTRKPSNPNLKQVKDKRDK